MAQREEVTKETDERDGEGKNREREWREEMKDETQGREMKKREWWHEKTEKDMREVEVIQLKR